MKGKIMFRMVSLGTVVMAGLLLQGCASVSSLEGKDMDSATSKTYSVGKEKVVAAAEKSVAELGYDFDRTIAAEPTSGVYFSKPMSAFSWGEVGRIDVTRVGENATVVSIASDKRFKLQVTGMTSADFAKKIFAKMNQTLAQ